MTVDTAVKKRSSQPRLSGGFAADIVAAAVRAPRSAADGVGLVVTPSLNHIAMSQRSSALACAYSNAERIVCGGWPVHLYARFCGLRLGRATGAEIASELMRIAPDPAWQRLFFVVDGAVTERALRAWADRHGVADRCAITVAPFGFEKDAAYSERLACMIAAYSTSVLILAVCTPWSEIFVDTHRALLPPCWAFCVGQAVKLELGLVQPAPSRWRSTRIKRLWRVMHEPACRSGRYGTTSIGFGITNIQSEFCG
ncbi:WecB/TagA/CpsF family glycosyltransferase [Rhodopila sp.]|uniref:WecB/TagA/CpsF family glycosyltransferase n=1 Tax=Rhodopila sp. TaxID=2480087 RepID=UPI003D098038